MVTSALPESGGWLAAGLPLGLAAGLPLGSAGALGDGAGDPLAPGDAEPDAGALAGADPEGAADPEAPGDASPSEAAGLPEALGLPEVSGLPEASAEAGGAVQVALSPAQPASTRDRPSAARRVGRDVLIGCLEVMGRVCVPGDGHAAACFSPDFTARTP